MGSTFTDFTDFTDLSETFFNQMKYGECFHRFYRFYWFFRFNRNFFSTRRDMGSDFTVFTNLFKPFLSPDEMWRVVSQVLLILQIHPNLFILPDEISLRRRGDPPYPIQSVNSIKTLSPHISIHKKTRINL